MLLPNNQGGEDTGRTNSLDSNGIAESNPITITFPATFPTACFEVLCTAGDVGYMGKQEIVFNRSRTPGNESADIYVECRTANEFMWVKWIAVGY